MTESEKMEVKRMYQEGVSISELSRRTGHDRKTIRKVVQEREDIEKPLAGTKRKGSKLEPYKPYVEQRMRFGVLNAERILREIREQGYTGGITVLREFMHPLRPVVSAKATVRFETAPGEQAQIDLGAFPYIDTTENRRTLWCFAMVLSYSRMLYLEFIKASDQLHILQALRNAVEFFGGVPKCVLSDNCAPLVLSNDGRGHVDWQPAYLDFACALFYAHYPTVFAKAAALFESLEQNHAFHNANERTAFLALLQFLSYNGYTFVMDQKQAEDFVVDVVNHKYTFEQIVEIIESNSQM